MCGRLYIYRFLSIQAQDFIEDHCLDSVPIGAGGYS